MSVEEIADRYLHGECMVLADTMSRLTGRPLVAIYDRVWDAVPRHVGVDMGDGRYADARGVGLDRTAFLAGYDRDAAEIRPITPQALRRIWGHRIDHWDASTRDLVALGLL